jgi:hypothetical protein
MAPLRKDGRFQRSVRRTAPFLVRATGTARILQRAIRTTETPRTLLRRSAAAPPPWHLVVLRCNRTSRGISVPCAAVAKNAVVDCRWKLCLRARRVWQPHFARDVDRARTSLPRRQHCRARRRRSATSRRSPPTRCRARRPPRPWSISARVSDGAPEIKSETRRGPGSPSMPSCASKLSAPVRPWARDGPLLSEDPRERHLEAW